MIFFAVVMRQCMNLLNCDILKYPSSALESNGITYLVVMASCRAPPALFPRADEIKQITLPEDVYVKKFSRNIWTQSMRMRSTHFFSQRVLELKESGVSEEEAMAVADMDRLEKKANKQAYA
ncbi:hypothetical protein EUGRSUZ_L00657 [Eucalyptus grandis]|uniref:Uncharacterized protein n=1 Tax=Eucalyptus grandis TaxID=71139 RepID=A0A058ZX20_EUCGR|nr:hypothetical protein EUGRSUZ_L00657 [Eucalyptus grandis]